MRETMTDGLRLGLICAGVLIAPRPALAQAAFTMDGTCETLVVAGRDLGAGCAGKLTNTVSRGRTSFDFTAGGQSVSFTGNGARQEATEESDPLQPINAVIEGASPPVLAVGACRFSTPQPGRTAIACEASTADGRTYAGTFVTAARPARPPDPAGGAPAR
jgi:hypothetical protein